MSNNTEKCLSCNCSPCRCVCPCPPIRPKPPLSATAAIPFSVGQNGVELSTDAQGNPQIIYFSGFGPIQDALPMILKEGEWEEGRITFSQDTPFGSAFVMPYNAVLRNIHILFSSKSGLFFESGSTVLPFVALATSNSNNLIYTIIQDTITYTEPYIGGISYAKHTLRRGAKMNLNVPIEEGTLVAIVLGIEASNVTAEQNARFSVAGGLFLE